MELENTIQKYETALEKATAYKTNENIYHTSKQKIKIGINLSFILYIFSPFIYFIAELFSPPVYINLTNGETISLYLPIFFTLFVYFLWFLYRKRQNKKNESTIMDICKKAEQIEKEFLDITNDINLFEIIKIEFILHYLKSGEAKSEKESLLLLSGEIKKGNIPVGISSLNNEIRFLKSI